MDLVLHCGIWGNVDSGNHYTTVEERTGPEVIKSFSCSTHKSMICHLNYQSEANILYRTANYDICSGHKGSLVIRRIFSLVDMITKPKFSNSPNVFKIGLFR